MRLTSASLPRALRSAAILVVGILIASLMAMVGPAERAEAAELPSGIADGGFIISDREYFNGSGMTAAQAQTFLEQRVPSCKATSGPTCLRNFTADLPAKAKDAYCAAIPAKKKVKASEIIVTIGKACGLNPKVILVMLQKEQGLVTSTRPGDWSYRAAMGMNCPDTAPCSAASAGFVNQVYLGARQQQVYAKNPTRYNYQAGRVNTVQWHPNAACGSSRVHIKNQATANLYIYTPYRPNVAALAAGYATGDGCSSYGNRNFYNYYVQWFAPQVSPNASGAPARINACTAPASADIAAASGSTTLVKASTVRRAPVATCATGAENLAKGAQVTITGSYGSWHRVARGSAQMWLPKDAVQVGAGNPAAGACAKPAESSLEKATGTAVVATTSLNARTAPSTACDTGRRTITEGQSFERNAVYGDWWRLRIAGVDYWAHSDYLTIKPGTEKKYATGPLHVRPSAGAGGAVVTLVTGAEVSVVQVQGGWSRVQVGSASGWVESRMLAAVKPRVPATSQMQTSGSVVLRSVMGSTGPAVRTLASGTKVTVVDASGSWRAVREGSSSGWVPVSSLTQVNAPAPVKAFSRGPLHVRPSAGAGGAVVTLVTGAEVSVVQVQGGWSRVQVGSASGWVESRMLAAVKPRVPATSQMQTSGSVVLRSVMGSTGPAVRTLASGTKVTVVDASGSWRAVREGSSSGWVPVSSLTQVNAPAPVKAFSRGPLHVRPSAGAGGAVVTLVTGAEVSVVQVQGGWSRVQVGSASGWVESRMLAAVKPRVPATSQMQTSGSVVLRSVMGSTGPAVRTLASGTKVTVVDASGSWRAVREGSSSGWVPVSSLTQVNAPAPVKAFSRGPLHVRPSAGAGGAVVTLVTGAEVSVVQVQGGWSRVQVGSASGWVESRMLAAVKPRVPATSQMQTSGSVVLRSVMGSTGPAVRTLASGTKVTVVDASGSWRAVREGSSSGWVPVSSLTQVNAPAPVKAFSRGPLHVRPSAGAGGAVVTLVTGAEVSVVQVQGGWSRVQVGSASGWVESRMLAAVKPRVPATSQMQTSGSVVLRSVMGSTGPAVRTLASGTKVTVVDASGSWRAVREGSSSGWVPVSSLTQVNAPAPVKAFSRGPLHVRPSAGAGGAVVTLVTGAEVSVVQVQGGWSRVQVGSASGWVESRMLAAVKPRVPATSQMQTSGSVVLRSVMGSTGPAVRTLASGTKVTVVDASGSWRAVREGSSSGWVPVSSLTQVNAPAPSTKTTTAALNLRAEPSTSARVITTLSRDTRVTVLASQGVWFRVQAGSTTGWVHGDFLR